MLFTMRLLILVSGSGTNLQAIIDCIKNKVLNCTITGVVSNKRDAFALERAKKNNIKTLYYPYNRKNSRERYDLDLADMINKEFEYDLIVLAGWMHILSNNFINNVKTSIINLHPALPGTFPGHKAIEDAFEAYQKGLIKYTGVMVHKVIEEIDAGEVLGELVIPIYPNDTIESLRDRIRYYEKSLLIKSIDLVTNEPALALKQENKFKLSYKGKVRDVYDIGNDLLAFSHSDRLSSFDRHMCDVPGKGALLTAMSRWWFLNTKHIVPNHYKWSGNNIMVCKKCTPYKIEVVVRGYITGSTSTSLWTHYKKGVRTYCGIKFPDNLVKNQKLEYPVLTPTTKGDVDIPISPEEIVSQGYMTQQEWDFISKKALELFTFGQKVAESRGLILVDTKYEFGIDSDSNILLIDEIHTCDSSRFWILDTYEDRFKCGMEPEKLDKDIVRSYVRGVCDPYKDPLPDIPHELIQKTRDAYNLFYNMIDPGNNITFPNKQADVDKFVDYYYDEIHNKLVVIIAGSERDNAWIDKITTELNKLNIHSKAYVASAHKTPKKVLAILDNYEMYDNRKIVYICVAGMTNALGGVVAANTRYPTINCPPFKDKLDLLTDINSSIRNPSYVPAMTVLSPLNTAICCKRILNL